MVISTGRLLLEKGPASRIITREHNIPHKFPAHRTHRDTCREVSTHYPVSPNKLSTICLTRLHLQRLFHQLSLQPSTFDLSLTLVFGPCEHICFSLNPPTSKLTSGKLSQYTYQKYNICHVATQTTPPFTAAASVPDPTIDSRARVTPTSLGLGFHPRPSSFVEELRETHEAYQPSSGSTFRREGNLGDTRSLSPGDGLQTINGFL